MAIIKLIISFLLSFTQILVPVDSLIQSGGEDAYFTSWSQTDVFDADDYVEIEKNPDEDFVILNLTDIQLDEEELYGDAGIYTEDLIRKIVAEKDPDLITLSGDNAWCSMAYIELVKLMDSFGIPWAPVMGNHDGQGCISEFWAAYNLASAENCLFQFGPEGMGYGNYIINITENDKIVHTLFMMDTHSNAEFTLEDGSVVEGYDHLWPNQLEWYEWAVNGIADIAGGVVESSVVIHIPVYEVFAAWDSVKIESENEFGMIDPANTIGATGQQFEYCCPAPVNNGFFALCKELGSTKNIIFGHDHVNDFSIPYEGIRLTYAVKSGFGCYWHNDMLGGTTLTINSDGEGTIQQHYYDMIENGWLIENDR